MRRNEGQRPKDRKGKRPIKPLIYLDHEKCYNLITFFFLLVRGEKLFMNHNLRRIHVGVIDIIPKGKEMKKRLRKM